MRTLVILAGGKSSRMGRDKVLLEIDGETFAEHLYKKASAYFERIIISTDTQEHAGTIKDLPAFVSSPAAAKPEFVVDLYSEKGPIGGIVSVFESTDTEKFSIISVDVPHADMQVLSFLYDHCENAAAYLRFEGRKKESLIAAYSRKAYPALKAALEAGEYKLRAALSDLPVDIYDPAEAAEGSSFAEASDIKTAFTNFNTPEDLQDL